MADYGLTPDRITWDDDAAVRWGADSVTYDDAATITLPYEDEWSVRDWGIVVPSKVYEYPDTWTYGDSTTVDVSGLGDTIDDPVPTGLHEERAVRTREVRVEDYGTVVVYGRRFIVPKGSAQTFLEGALAPGSPMYPAWADTDATAPVRWIDGPKVVAAKEAPSANAARDAIEATFVAFRLPKARVANGYNETARNEPVNESNALVVMTTWGIAGRLGGSTEPQVGEILDDGAELPTSYMCRSKQYNRTALPGRVLIQCEWEASRADAVWPEAGYATE